jgi:hypothetical protein
VRSERPSEIARAVERRHRILILLEKLGRPVSLGEIWDEIDCWNRTSLVALIAEGRIRRVSYGRYALAEPDPLDHLDQPVGGDEPGVQCPSCWKPSLGAAVARRHDRLLYRCPTCNATYFHVDPAGALRP